MLLLRRSNSKSACSKLVPRPFFRVFVRHFEFLYGLPLCTRFPFPVPRSPFPVPRSPFPVPRSSFPVPRFPFPVSRFPFPVPRSPFPVSRFPFPVPRSPFPVPGISNTPLTCFFHGENYLRDWLLFENYHEFSEVACIFYRFIFFSPFLGIFPWLN